MLPLVDRPAIQYVVEEAVQAGLEQIIIVTAASKRAVEDHFDRQPDLEQVLESAQKGKEVQEIRRVADLADIAYVRQKERLGIGHSVLMARNLVGDEPFALFFPDDIIESRVPAIKQLMDVFDRHGGSVLAVQRLPRQELPHYGVIEPKPVEERVYQVLGIIEKPREEEAPSDLATVGRYVLTPALFPILERTPPGAGGEIQLTDGLATLLEQESLFACRYEGERFDVGRPLGFLMANLYLGLRRADLAPELRSYAQRLLSGEGGVAASGGEESRG
jgi:UTP--glucose-1-phosphate uridylyltransferase